MIVNRSVQHGRAQDAVPNSEALMKLTGDREKEQTGEHEIMKKREIQLWHDRRDAQRTRRIVRDQLNRRWARHTTVNNSCNVLSLYKLRF